MGTGAWSRRAGRVELVGRLLSERWSRRGQSVVGQRGRREMARRDVNFMDWNSQHICFGVSRGGMRTDGVGTRRGGWGGRKCVTHGVGATVGATVGAAVVGAVVEGSGGVSCREADSGGERR